MTHFSRLCIAGALTCVVPLSIQAAPISFQQAWTLLQTNNNSLAAQRMNVERYQHLQSATDSLNLPSVTVGATYTRLDDDVTLSGKQIADSLNVNGSQIGQIIAGITGNPIGGAIANDLGKISSTITEKDVFASSIRAVWPIFTGGRITAAQDAAKGRSKEATAQLAMETQARYEDLSKYYFSVLLAKEVLKTRQSVEAGLKQHRDFAIKLETQGQIAKVERLQAEASFDKATIERKKSQRDLQIAESALTEILGEKTTVEPSGQLFVNKTLPPLTAFVDQTLATYPGLELLDAKSSQAKSLMAAEKGKYYPEVYLFGNYSLYEDDSLASQMKPDWLVGVGVNIPLIENTGRSQQIKAAHSAVSQVNYLKQQAKQDLSVLVKKTYLEAEQSIEEVNGLSSSIDLAKENLSLRQKAFNQGLANSLEVIDAQLYLASIETQQSVARFHYLLSLNKLLALSSELEQFGQYKTRAKNNSTIANVK